MSISEDTFISWSKGPGATEDEKCANAVTAVRKAIAADAKLSGMGVAIFAQGSYRVRTNIRLDSDVDICVRYDDAFFADYPQGKAAADFGHKNDGLVFGDFKNMVEAALQSYFGADHVTRGNKAFDVHANTYRIDADVVPAFEHRRYTGSTNANESPHYVAGVEFRPDNGGRVINWPEQTYNNGVSRNDATGRRYKRVIRILKRLRNKMQEENIAAADNVASFLIECLVWNAPDDAFQHDTYALDVREVIADLWRRTRKDEDCADWREVNELKYLFRPSQPWTRQQANDFLQAAWNHIGFK